MNSVLFMRGASVCFAWAAVISLLFFGSKEDGSVSNFLKACWLKVRGVSFRS
jgi:hypothetical protein